MTRNFRDVFLEVLQGDPLCQGPCPPSLLSGTLNILQVPPSKTGGSWHTSIYTRILKFGTQVRYPISRTTIWSRMTHFLNVSSQDPQYPPSHWRWQDGSWHTSNHARIQKIGTQVGNQISRTIMRPIRIHVLHVSFQETSMFFKSLMMGGVLDTLLIMLESWNFALMLDIIYQEHLKCQGWLMPSMSPVRNPQSPPNHL